MSWEPRQQTVLMVCFWIAMITVASRQIHGDAPLIFSITPPDSEHPRGVPGERSVQLTAEETAFLATHPTIRAGIMKNWPPMDFASNEKPAGIGMDYLLAINQRLAHRFSVEAGDFDSNLQKVKTGQLDIIFDVTPKEERKAYLNFTRPYILIPHVLVTRKNHQPYLDNEHSLAHSKLALERGFYNVTYFNEHFPEVKILLFDSTSDALDAVSRGVADAYAGNRAVALYLMESQLLTNLEIQGRLQKPPVALTIGVRKDWPELASILDRLLAAVSPEQKRLIYQRWSGDDTETAEAVPLTREEREWLARNPVIQMGYDANWAPIEYVNEKGKMEGLSVDYMHHLEKLLNVTFEFVSPRPWSEMLQEARAGRIDALSALTETEERAGYLDFTAPYLSFPMVIVTREDVTFIADMVQLNNKKVGVVSAYAAAELIRKNYPQIQIVSAKDVRDGLLDVVEGRTDAFVGSLAAISWVIAREGLANLKVSGETPFAIDLCVGVQKTRPLLLSSIQKALNAIEEEEKAEIYRKWFNITYEHKRDYSLVWQILFATVFLVGLFIAWNRQLAREVRRRKQTEGELKKAMVQAQAADHIKSAFLATMSHELRTPLNSIIGFTGILLQKLAGPLNDEQHKQLSIIRNAGNHLLSLINDVLDISKIEAGQLELFNEPFSMDESLEQVTSTIRPLAEQKGLTLEISGSEKLGVVVGDQRRVNQVLLNLLNNAVKFTQNGKITLTAEKYESHIAIQVTDTGTGIKTADLDKLFRPFQQIDIGINRTHEGTGLGLSICQRLVSLWGGEIDVKSEWGTGSTFSFTIPLAVNPIEQAT